jgi:transcriptional regulator with XRE-family HTH domain
MTRRRPKENHGLNALMLDLEHMENPRSRPSEEPELGLGARLAKLREEREWSQEQLSQATRENDARGEGISRAVISMYERGKNRPGTREFRILCDTLRVTPSELLYGTPTPFEIDKWQILNSNHSHPLYYARWLHLFCQLDANVQMAIYELVIEFLRPTQAQVARLDYEASKTLLQLANELRTEFKRGPVTMGGKFPVEVLAEVPPVLNDDAARPAASDDIAPQAPHTRPTQP